MDMRLSNVEHKGDYTGQAFPNKEESYGLNGAAVRSRSCRNYNCRNCMSFRDWRKYRYCRSWRICRGWRGWRISCKVRFLDM